jgi:hypoxanthine phosphoribosyltransferase
MSKWNFVAMGQAGLTGRTRTVAQPIARSIARKTGRPEAQILSLIGGVFLAIALIDFLREVDAVIAAGRTGRQTRT